MEKKIRLKKAIFIFLSGSLSICLLYLLLHLSCGIKKHPFLFGYENTTEYVYNMSLEELRDLVKNEFENPANPDVEEILCRKMEVSTITEFLTGLIDSVSYPFYQIKSMHDLILEYPVSTHSTTLGYSDVYYKKNMPLLYSASFHLHFEQIDADMTKIKVYVLEPKVAVGEEILAQIIIPSHAGYSWKSVKPTTIEEYKILLRIGKVVGEKMPPLRKPYSGYHVPGWL